MFKRLITVIILAIVINWCFGQTLSQWLDMHVMVDGQQWGTLGSLAAIMGVGVVMVLIGFFVAMSLVGVLCFASIMVVGALLLAGMTALWPFILFVALVVWLVRDHRASPE